MCALAHLYLQTDKRTWPEEKKCVSRGRRGVLEWWWRRSESFDREQLQGKVNNEEVEQMKSYPLLCSACAAVCLKGEKKS